MEIILVVIIGVIFFYLFKSFQGYIQNPHHKFENNSSRGNNQRDSSSKERFGRGGGFGSKSSGEEFGFFKSIKKDTSPTYKEYKLIIALMAKVAKADGSVSELEAELVSNTLNDLSRDFPDPAEAREELKKIFSEEKDRSDNVEELALEFSKVTKGEYYKRVKVMEFLLNIAYIDSVLSDEERDIIIDIAAFFELSNEDFNKIYDEFDKFYKDGKKKVQSSDEAYGILGLSREDSDEDVKKKYRELVKKYHPDIMRGKGLEDDFIELATRKLQEINSAYEEVKKERGL